MIINELRENIKNKRKVVEIYCKLILDSTQGMVDDYEQLAAEINAEIVKEYGTAGLEEIKREVLGNYGCVA